MVKSTDCSSRGPEFNSQQPHGGLKPSVVRSDVPFWHADVHADRALKYIKRDKLQNMCFLATFFCGEGVSRLTRHLEASLGITDGGALNLWLVGEM